MNVKIHPSEILSYINASPSYDATLKAIMLAVMSRGVSKITDADLCDDVITTLNAVKAVGAGVMYLEDGILISGIDMKREYSDEEIFINVGKSAVSVSLLLPLATYLFRNVTFIMDFPPKPFLDAYEELYKNRGMHFVYGENFVTVSGRLSGGDYHFPQNVSFPYFDGLLLLAPCFEENTRIFYSKSHSYASHLAHTVEYMKLFGSNAMIFPETAEIPGRQKYFGRNIKPEKDYLKASQFMVLGSIIGRTEIYGFKEESIVSPDAGVVDILSRCDIPVYDTEYGYSILKKAIPPINADLGRYPDIIPIMIVRCAFSEGYSVIKGIDKVKLNEHSRITDLIYELRKSDVDIGIQNDSVIIKGRRFYFGSEFYTYGDPLIASALGIFAACCLDESIINGAEAVNRWYPELWEDMRCAGINAELL